MNKKLHAAIVLIAAVAGFGLSNALFTVDETQYAIVLQFGQPVSTKTVPGLHVKMPFIQNVIYLDNRLMEYDMASTIIYTKDKKNMVVDAYVRWRVKEPLAFYTRFKSDSSYSIVEEAKRRLGDVIIGVLKSELGLHDMSDIISQSRNTVMERVNDESNKKLAEEGATLGLEVVDVRIKKADLPAENQLSVYERMKTERNQQATKYRSEGEMKGRLIRAEADRKRAEIIAEANRKSQEIRGQADAEAASVYSEAYGLDPEFYAFVRSLESYQKAFQDKSTLVISAPETMEYLEYFGREKTAP
ncbi:MAG: protease modulator HflC [Candidatus Adiutrix sp.]|jgi:membrane protease subunit HflC|nr:protease modulator HflC [Candidatus Adiutrix sp.]